MRRQAQMSAPGITYSGVLAEKGANSSGIDEGAGVFRGLKLWVSARVPNRKACVDTIEKNGGTVALKEGSADILICDQANQPVPGSYSYRLIQDAVKEGSLDIKDDYLCDVLAASSGVTTKPVAKNKLTRVAFTKEDDQILTKYVLEMETEGKSTSGNDIYKEFAKKHTRHTWQSWRDRWTKKLKYLPRPPIPDKHSPQPRGTSEAPSSNAAARKSPVVRSRARFTAEEDDIILEIIRHAIENHEAWAGYPPYKRLASEFPQRTYQSWRERALNHVARQHKDQITQWEFEAGFSPSDKEDAPVEKDEEQRTPTAEDQSAITIKPSEDAPMQATTSLPKGTTIGEMGDMDGIRQEDQNASSSPIYKPVSPKMSAVTNFTIKNGALDDSASTPMLGVLPPADNGISITTEGQFYRDYNVFLENAGIMERTIPTVRGKAVTLWSLWQSVRSKRVDISELDWQQVAEDLGFDWVSMESVPEELRQCYEEYLAPFAYALVSYVSDDEESVEESTENNADVETEGLLPSSPPLLPSLKRSLPTASPAFILQASPKRRRIDRSQEIPSTPENKTRGWNLRSSIDPGSTPTRPRPSHTTATKPVSKTRAPVSTHNGGIANPPGQTPGRKRQLEPETQDFAFAPETQVYTHGEGLSNPDYDSDRDATPSQQLRLESDGMSPHIEHNDPAFVSPRQEVIQTTPTPDRKIRVPFQVDNPDKDNVQRNSRERNTRPSLSAQQAQPKRRTLPSSYTSKPPASPEALRNDQPSSAPVPEPEPQRRRSPPQETPDDIIDRFVSLGYGKDIVLHSLKATSWIIGNAGQVMEMLKQGEPLPQRTTGVWTQRDDDSLALVFSQTPPATAKEEKKREKEMRRLQAKHGDEQIALRKQYLLDEIPE